MAYLGCSRSDATPVMSAWLCPMHEMKHQYGGSV